MGYVTTDFLKTQFQNYSTKVEEIFRKKSDSYSKEEVDNLISAVNGMSKEIVQELPTENISESTIYLVPNETAGENNSYTEYIYLNGQWESLGSTDSVNLEGYVKEDDLETTLSDYLKKSDKETTDIDFSGFFAEEEEEPSEEV